jgi:hypothetical protein
MFRANLNSKCDVCQTMQVYCIQTYGGETSVCESCIRNLITKEKVALKHHNDLNIRLFKYFEQLRNHQTL